jgi:molecular chaperone GrpE
VRDDVNFRDDQTDDENGAAERAQEARAGSVAQQSQQSAEEQTETRADAGELQRQLEDQRDKYLRLAAEYDNYRKRVAKERLEVGPRAQAELLRPLLDSLDDLARVAHVDVNATDVASVVQGVDLVEQKMLKTLGAAGLEVLNPVDEPFNPELHEAIATQPALSPEDDHVVAQVYQPGYLFKGQLLRPARVVVKQWTE